MREEAVGGRALVIARVGVAGAGRRMSVLDGAEEGGCPFRGLALVRERRVVRLPLGWLLTLGATLTAGDTMMKCSDL